MILNLSGKTQRLFIATLFTTLATSQLSGCAPLVVGGAAATTAMVATDRRTAGEQVDDKTIGVKIAAEVREILGERPGRVNSTSYGGQVLLVGDVPSAADSQKIENTVKQIDSVKQVINRLRIGPVTELSVRTNDSWITTKATTALVNAQDVPSRTISVTTERGVVYLQGRVTHAEGDRAARAVATVAGVQQVVKLFEYVSAEKILLPQKQSASPAAPKEQPSPQVTPAANASEPEVFTIE
ncbi:BON domain-containing protein [Paenalcaligenes hermetiae]|uniref:BON domain-containing protein n=1 Tax=Paenalcaligenes hermetiae TaxID=1157987 RepID=A0ABP9M3P3_9BURK